MNSFGHFDYISELEWNISAAIDSVRTIVKIDHPPIFLRTVGCPANHSDVRQIRARQIFPGEIGVVLEEQLEHRELIPIFGAFRVHNLRKSSGGSGDANFFRARQITLSAMTL